MKLKAGNNTWRLGLGAFLFLLFTISSTHIYPQDTIELQKQGADVRVVIDVSGSMKQNDPNNLRQPALELLVKLLPDGSKAGVWTFGKYINMLVPHRDVTAAWRQDALDKGQEINSAGLYTNIGEALEKAAYDIDRRPSDYKTSIILLTDGVVDIDREPELNQKEWRRIVDEVLPKLKSAGYTVHTIALSDNADSELMNKLAIATDGIAAVATTADELMKIFLEAFENAAPAEQVPLRDNTFVVDSSVEEFTALIFTKPGSKPARLISPELTEYSFDAEDRYVNWYRADQYDLITVQKPIEGEWQVKADLEPDSRITIVSNLNLVVKPLKNNLIKDQAVTLSLLLSEGGKTITRSNFLDLLSIDYVLERESDGQQWQGLLTSGGSAVGSSPANGIFSTELNHFDRDDDYTLNVLVDGKSFTREFNHRFSVRQPFSVKTALRNEEGKSHYRISVSYYGDEVDLQETKVATRITDPEGRNSIKPFGLSDTDTWELDFVPELEGSYEFALRINAVDKSGKEFEVVLDTLVIEYPESDNPFAKLPDNTPPPPIIIEPPEPSPAAERPAREEPEAQPTPEDESLKQEAAAEPPIDTETEAETGENKWLLYVGLGAGNVLILLLAYMAYRMIMGNKKDPELDELEQAVAELDKSVNSAKAEEKSSAPSMADMDASAGSGGMAAEMMSEDLNLDSGEEEGGSSIEEMPAMHQEDDSKDDEDLGVTDVEFSLDDFSSDDLDEDDKD